MTPVTLIVTLHGHDPVYVSALAALYASIRTHTQAALDLWILHDKSVPADRLSALTTFIRERDTVHCVDVDEHPAIARVGIEFGCPPYSPAVIWRLYAAELCGADRAILLDADLLFLSDIASIWNVDVEGAPLAASLRGKPWPAEYHSMIRTPPQRYFRMGVSLLNLAYLRADAEFTTYREEFLRTRLPAINALVPLQEQSVFNYFFSHAAVPLNVNLCPVAHFDTEDPSARDSMLERMSRYTNLILDVKGWQDRSPFDAFYWCYLMMTPWKQEAYAHLDRQRRRARATEAEQTSALPQSPPG
ncbi:MAG: glycosyltransferase [Vicinamibacterales bacterium]